MQKILENMPRNILDQNWSDFFNKNGLQWQEGSLFGKNFTADQVGNLYGIAGNIIGTAGDVVNNISNQYYAQNAGRADLANTVSGNSWGDVFSHSDKLSQGLQTISALQKDYSGVKNNANLLNTWNSNDLQDEVHDSVEVGGVIGSTLSDTGKLAAAGSIFGPVGTLVGGATGLLSGLGRGLISAFQHNDAEEELNDAIKLANRAQVNNFYTTAKNNQQYQQRQAMMNYFDNGGSLDELNGVTKFNVGDTHENNPYGGIQQGIASDNLPNMVEEGEVKWNDYIFSARSIPSESLLKKYKLI